MTPPVRFVYYVACSADGQIARANGAVDWLDGATGDYGAKEFMQSIGTILWGRKTFEHGLQLGGLAPFGDTVRHIVLSRHPPPPKMEPHVEFTDASPAEVARRLRMEAKRDVWVMGGAGLAASLLGAGAVDELVLHVIPVLLGPGVPLVRALPRDIPLRLLETKAFPDGVVRLRYLVHPSAASKG